MALGLILLTSVFAFGASAGAVEPQSPAEWNASIDPDECYNDGLCCINFTWDAWDLGTGTGEYQTFSIRKLGAADPIYIQSSALGDTFPGVTVPLVSINNTPFGPTVHVTNPEHPDPHTWKVPQGFEPGDYIGRVDIYIQGQDEPEATQLLQFDVHPTGNLTVIKYRSGTTDGLDDWTFSIEGTDGDALDGLYGLYTATNITSGGGITEFNWIPTGTYTVTESVKNGWECTVPGSSGVMTDVVVTNSTTTIYFENQELIGNLEIIKYEDQDDSGDYTAGEPLLPDWDFSVAGPHTESGTTGVDGKWVLTGIPIGDYTITETLKSGWESTDPGGSTPSKQDTVATGQTTTVYFGNIPSIGELVIFKYNDLNGNGSYDSGTEQGLADWYFEISGPNNYSDDGWTDTNGLLTFTGIPAGSYTVTETLQDHWRCTEPGNSLKYDNVAVPTAGSITVDFGNQELGQLIIFKYEDQDESGDFNAEPGLPGWRFNVTGPGGYVSGDLYTESSGEILLVDLVPGTYTVTETLKTNHWKCTDPGGNEPFDKNVPVDPAGIVTVMFGNYEEEPPPVPTVGQWGMIIMAGVFAFLLVLVPVWRKKTAATEKP